MHLSESQIDLYHRRALPPTDLLAVDDHLQVCEACRRRLARDEPLDAARTAWESLLGEAPPAESCSSAPLPQRRDRRAGRAARPRPALIAALVLLGFVIGFFALPPCRAAVRRLLPRFRREASPAPPRPRRGHRGESD